MVNSEISFLKAAGDVGGTYPLTIDSHFFIRRQVQIADLLNIPNLFHIGCITSRAKYTANFCFRLHVAGRNERPCGVIDERGKSDWKSLDNQGQLVPSDPDTLDFPPVSLTRF